MNIPGWRTLFVFSLPALLQGFMHAPAGIALKGVYAKEFGVPLIALGSAIVVAKVLDAITDPAVGLISDSWHRRNGTRKHLLIVGSVLAAASLWFLYRPAEGATAFWFGIFFYGAYLGWSITEISYRAWSIELTAGYNQRTRIAMWLAIFSLLGGALFYLIPTVSKALGWAPTTELTGQTLGVAAVIILIFMPLANLLAVWFVPNGIPSVETADPGLKSVLRTLRQNRPFVIVISLYLLIGLATGMTAGVTYFYVDSYLQLGEHLSLLLLLIMPMSVLGTPFWAWACNKFEKHRAWAIAGTIIALMKLSLIWVEPGEGAFTPMLVAFLIIMFCAASTHVALPAILGDVNDYGLWKSGQDCAGAYFSFYTLAVQVFGSLGTASGMIIAGSYGFDPTEAVMTSSGITGLKLTFLWLPSGMLLVAAFFLWRFPITRERHAKVLAELEHRSDIRDETSMPLRPSEALG